MILEPDQIEVDDVFAVTVGVGFTVTVSVEAQPLIWSITSRTYTPGIVVSKVESLETTVPLASLQMKLSEFAEKESEPSSSTEPLQPNSGSAPANAVGIIGGSTITVSVAAHDVLLILTSRA